MKTIVITGSTKGIGFGLAHEFLKSGHQVSINARTEESVNNALEKLAQFKKRVFSVQGNVMTTIFFENLLT